MATLNVPGTYRTIADAVAASHSGDVIVIAPDYPGQESVNVTVNGLSFDAPASVQGVVLTTSRAINVIKLLGSASIAISDISETNDIFIGNDGNNVITASYGSDTIDGGGGNDTISAYGDGHDALSGGEGADKFVIEHSYDDAIITIDGGADLDTLKTEYLEKITVENVEVLNTSYVYGEIKKLALFRKITDSAHANDHVIVSLQGKGGVIDLSDVVTGRDSVALHGSGLSSGIKVTGSNNDDILDGTSYKDTLNGGAGDDEITGRRGDDINGGAGDDTLIVTSSGNIDGGLGIDTVIGNDLVGTKFKNVETLDAYRVNATISQLSSFSSVTCSDPFMSSIAVNLRGSSGHIDFSKIIHSTEAIGVDASRMTGGLVITATKHNDYIRGSNHGDTIHGNDGADKIQGSGGRDVIYGDAGDDRFQLGYIQGQGRFDGGTGTDTVEGRNLGNLLFSHVEVLRTSKASGTIAQLSKFDKITNAPFATYQIKIDLHGAGGEIDFSARISSNDGVLIKDHGLTSNVKIAGTAHDDILTGSAFNDVLRGGKGDDVLDGGKGADVLTGGARGDTYFVDNAADKVIESTGRSGGNDTIMSSVTIDALAANIENLVLNGKSNLGGIGNSLANTLVGNSGNNTLDGGLGSDVLTGHGGKDTFLFSTSLKAPYLDHIRDFSTVDDTIKLDNSIFRALAKTGSLAEDAFALITSVSQTVSPDAHILYDKTQGTLYYDANGGSPSNRIEFAVVDNHAALTFQDFLIVG